MPRGQISFTQIPFISTHKEWGYLGSHRAWPLDAAFDVNMANVDLRPPRTTHTHKKKIPRLFLYCYVSKPMGWIWNSFLNPFSTVFSLNQPFSASSRWRWFSKEGSWPNPTPHPTPHVRVITDWRFMSLHFTCVSQHNFEMASGLSITPLSWNSLAAPETCSESNVIRISCLGLVVQVMCSSPLLNAVFLISPPAPHMMHDNKIEHEMR